MRRSITCFRALLALMVGVLAIAPPAAAQTNAPPGNSGVDQYFEVVPNARGNSAPGGKRKALSPKVRRELGAHGETGRQLERVVGATAPDRSRKGRAKAKSERGAVSGESPRGDSPLSSAAKSLTADSDGGMGFALPALLVGSTIALALFAWRRRRQAQTPSA